MNYKRFLFYLTNTITGACYWLDQFRHVQETPITTGPDRDYSILTPGGWDQMELGFMKNMTYFGFNRSFSLPMQLVKDAAFIARTIFYTTQGRGIETPLTLVVLKYNDQPQPGEGTYELYYKGALDLPQWEDEVAYGVKCNTLEGSVIQLVKAYENKVVEIPCDGSIVENIKANLDGVYYQDTMRFQFTPMPGNAAETGQGVNTIAMSFMDEDGDSFGVQHGNQDYEPLTTPYPQTSGNYSLQFDKPTIVTLDGFITVKPFDGGNDARFNLGWFTSLSKGNILLGGGHSGVLVPALGEFPDVTSGGGSIPSGSDLTHVTQQSTYYFNQKISLQAGENLFIYWTDIPKGGSGGKSMSIVGGQLNATFITIANVTAPWGMTLYDVFRKVWEYICQTASQQFYPMSFPFKSDLLQQRLDLFITCGDALRASGDPNYQKFYNAIQNNPNFPNLNLTYSYGPVIKITLRQCFDAARVLCFASMGNEQLTGTAEMLFVELMNYVFDSTGADTFDIGEVAEMKLKVNKDFQANILQIGYPNQDYDQRGGKYEPNTTAEWTLPFKSFTGKILQLICPIRADTYAMERLRSNITSTSSTRNTSDSSNFVIRIDRSKAAQDIYQAYFQSPISDTTLANNTNAKLAILKLQQPVFTAQNRGGGYFLQQNEPSIFVLNQGSLSGVSKPLRVDIAGNLLGSPANLLAGTPADNVTIKLFINGVVQNTWSFDATGAITPFSIIGYIVTRGWSYKDCIYVSIATSSNGTATINTGSLQMDTGGAYWQASVVGLITADPGTANKLIAFPAVAASLDPNHQEVVSYGFQYWMFNSIVINNNFDYSWTIQGFINGSSSWHGEADLFLNGVPVNSAVFPPAGPTIPFAYTNGGNKNLQLGDIFFITAGCGNLNMWISAVSMTFTSTQTIAYSPYRVKYKQLIGIPNFALDADGIPDSSLAGAPYNLEGMTPKDLFKLHFPFIKAICFDQPGLIYFNTLGKNKYTTRIYDDESIVAEAANVVVADMGDPLFIPRNIEAKLQTPAVFQKVLTGAANSHIKWTYGGFPIFGFGLDLRQKPAFLDAMNWTLLLSPKTPLSTFVDLNLSGLNPDDMPNNSLNYPFLSPFQWFPEDKVLEPQYHTKNRDEFPFVEQITRWINTRNYIAPWQKTDPISLQFVTKGLGNIHINIFKCGQTTDDIPAYQFDMNLTVTAALADPLWLFQLDIDPSGWDSGVYFMEAVAGASGSTAKIVCEGFDVQDDQPDTILFKLNSSRNTQGMYFTDTNYSPVCRFFGTFDNRFQQKYIGQFYKDQSQNVTILNATPFEITKLWIGFFYGVPDWVCKKAARMLLLDGLTIEGEGFTLDERAEWEYVENDGAPMKYAQIAIRPTDNLNGVSVPATMEPEDSTMIATTDALGFGPNAYNESLSTTPEIIQILVTP